MIAYHPDEIQISPQRQRQEFDASAMEELRDSIHGKQLQHAPVVRSGPSGPILVSGERRLRTIRDIFALGGGFWHDGIWYEDKVPTVTLGELSPLDAEEAELDENLKRKDLTWQEVASATKRLHELRGKQKAAAGLPTTQSYTETAVELYPDLADRPPAEMGARKDEVRKSIILANHLDRPEIAAAKDVREAWKLLKKSEASREHQELALKVGATFTAGLHQLYQADCLEWMAQQPTATFDVILTDPPYGMDAQDFGDGGGKLSGITHKYEDSYDHWKSLMASWTELSFALAKPQAHAYVFCDIDNFHELKLLMEAAGWYVHRTPLIDYKEGSGRVPLPDRGPRRCWEMILYAIKGNKPVTHIYPDVIPCRADENMTHGAQKPVALYQNLLMRSVRPGDRVLDTFAGSGTIFPAAHAMQCVAVGVEREATSYGMCLSRLNLLKGAEDPLSQLAIE